MGNGTWIPWDLCPETDIPGLGTEIGTDSLWTLGTGKYRWDSPGTKIIFFRKIPKSRDCPLDLNPSPKSTL